MPFGNGTSVGQKDCLLNICGTLCRLCPQSLDDAADRLTWICKQSCRPSDIDVRSDSDALLNFVQLIIVHWHMRIVGDLELLRFSSSS
jgi:hypothetical protein